MIILLSRGNFGKLCHVLNFLDSLPALLEVKGLFTVRATAYT